MIEAFRLIFFSLKLGVFLAKTLMETAIFSTPTTYKVLGMYALFSISAAVLITTSVTAKSATIITPAPSHPHQELYQVEITTQEGLEQKKAELEKLLSLQPTHLDLIINLALVNQTLGNNKEYERLWQEAELIDPNNPIFAE